MTDLLKLTDSERIIARQSILFGDAAERVEFWRNEDGTWALQVAGFVFEAATPGNLFRELAAIVDGDA